MTTPDFGSLFETNPGPPSDFYYAFLALFAVLFVTGVATVMLRRTLYPNDHIRERMTRRFGWYTLSLGAIGLMLLGSRFAAVPYLGMRVWLLVALAAVPALAAYMFAYQRVRYPRLAARYRASQLERRYAAPTRSTSTARRNKKRRHSR